MVRRVGLDLVRGVFTSASERTYQGYFGHFVKYSVEMVNRPMLLVENPDLTGKCRAAVRLCSVCLFGVKHSADDYRWPLFGH